MLGRLPLALQRGAKENVMALPDELLETDVDLESDDTPVPPPVPPPDKPPSSPPAKTFTQDEVNKLMAKERKSMERKLQEQNESTQKQIVELQQKMSQPPEPKPSDTDVKGQLELMEKKHKREQEALEEKLVQTNSALAQEKKKRLETERDKELGDALQTVGCVDMTMGRRFFLPDIEYDEDESRWMYRTASGNLISIIDGVQENMPNYLKPPAMQGGGSGSARGAAGKGSTKQRVL